jgi:hypothetical protein
MSGVSAHFTTEKFPDIKGPSHEMATKFYEINKQLCIWVIYFRMIFLFKKY